MPSYQEIRTQKALPIGSVMPWPGTITRVPSGWLFCNGAEVQADEYPLLARILRDSYGGSGFGGEFPNYKVDSGQAQSLSVTTVPAVFLVDPPNVITPIGQGAMSLDELNNRIILAAHQAGWIDDQTYYATRPVQPGVSLAMSAQELNEKILQDPEFLVRYLRAQVGL